MSDQLPARLEADIREAFRRGRNAHQRARRLQRVAWTAAGIGFALGAIFMTILIAAVGLIR